MKSTPPASQTTDLVARIRARPNDAPIPTERLLDEAADEIVRLRTALQSIWDMPGDRLDEAWITCRDALGTHNVRT